MTNAKIAHDLEADISVVINGRTYAMTVGYNIRMQGAVCRTVESGIIISDEIHFMPRVDIVGLWDIHADADINIYPSFRLEARGLIREALDRYIVNNTDTTDPMFWRAYDSRTGMEYNQ